MSQIRCRARVGMLSGNIVTQNASGDVSTTFAFGLTTK